jgi:hypothetical protein
LYLSGGEIKEKPAYELSGGRAVMKYPSGAKMEYETRDGELICRYSDLPETASGLMFQMILPIKLKDGGKYAFGEDALKEFPQEKGGQFVKTGQRDKFVLVDASGDGFSLEAITNWYGLQDNRVFGWQAFAYTFLYDVKAYPGKSELAIKAVLWKP